MKAYSEDAEQNKIPILEVLERVLSDSKSVLEIGSGTGQHAVFFGSFLSHLSWQTSELEQQHSVIRGRLNDNNVPNVLPPLFLDVAGEWPGCCFEAVFSSNTVHIVSLSHVELMFCGIGKVLKKGGVFVLYGPFNYGGEFTCDSNRKFDDWLKNNDSNSGIRNFEDLNLLAEKNGLMLEEDVEMPVNNRILVWRRT